jgi:hypothetical protein
VPAILYADHVEGIGTSFYKAECERDCEGVIAKHRLGPYEPVPVTWFKILILITPKSAAEKNYSRDSASASTWVLDTTTGSRNDPEPPPFSTSSVFSPSSSETQQHHPRTASLQSS